MKYYTTNFENFECPQCGHSFGAEETMDLCSEPFNGITVQCPECEKEWNLDLIIRFTEA